MLLTTNQPKDSNIHQASQLTTRHSYCDGPINNFVLDELELILFASQPPCDINLDELAK